MELQTVSPAYRKQALRILIEQTEGWGLLLERVFAVCKEAETTISNPQWSADVRHDAIGRKNALLGLVDSLYREADLSSPFEQHYARLLTALRLAPPPLPLAPDEAVATPAGPAVPERLQRRRAGSVA